MFPNGFKQKAPFSYYIQKKSELQQETSFKENIDFLQTLPIRMHSIDETDSLGCVINEKDVLVAKVKDK